MAARKYYYKRKKNRKRKFGAFLLISFGIGVLFYIFFPLISFQLYISSTISEINIESPLPKIYDLRTYGEISEFFPVGVANATDSTVDARTWFPNIEVKDQNQQKIEEYKLSIPSLQIYNATVSTEDFDLSKHLVQYYSTSQNPVENGTSVIFGHSTLPQWFDPDDYTKIFAKVHLLKIGDEIVLTVNGKKYTYKIISKTILSKDDPKVFFESFDNSYISLVTCTPPGTKWKRLVVRASLEKI